MAKSSYMYISGKEFHILTGSVMMNWSWTILEQNMCVSFVFSKQKEFKNRWLFVNTVSLYGYLETSNQGNLFDVGDTSAYDDRWWGYDMLCGILVVDLAGKHLLDIYIIHSLASSLFIIIWELLTVDNIGVCYSER